MHADLLRDLTTLAAAVLAAGTVIVRTRAELRDLARRILPMAHALTRSLDQVSTELSPNHGSSTRDAITRTEAATHDQTQMLRELARDVGGIREELRRLARVDDADRQREHDEHARIWAAIEHHHHQETP